MSAGRAWAEAWRGRGGDDFRSDAEKFGLDVSDWDDDNDEDDAIWPDHAEALNAFLVVASQWRVIAPAGGGIFYSGLDYSAVDRGWHMAGVAVTPDLFTEVQIIEAGARVALNEP